ncbi:2-dehydropantoate 2-reductase N-terminal domain-containing protein, partial [Methylibium sp. T29]|uniref:ketopantoate reductase family protein n=1 Tax=Methylibium sp. T29 TaxID=1430884 RepID=UPI001378480B
MRIAVVGLGAVGGFLAARLVRGGHRVSALARGAALAAVREHGLRLDEGGRVTAHAIDIADDAAALGPQELVIVAVKSPALAAVAERLAPLLGPDTPVLTAMNGVPGGSCRRCRPAASIRGWRASIPRAASLPRCRWRACSAAWCTSPAASPNRVSCATVRRASDRRR